MALKLPDELAAKVARLSPMQRSYCEFRAKNLTQSESLLRAGSTSDDPQSRARMGYQIEQIDGAKDYIQFLGEQRTHSSALDAVEIITKLRDVYDQSMASKSFKDANKALEQMAMIIGLLGKGNGRSGNPVGIPLDEVATRNNVDAFKEEDDPTQTVEVEDRIKKLQEMALTIKVDNK